MGDLKQRVDEGRRLAHLLAQKFLDREDLAELALVLVHESAAALYEEVRSEAEAQPGGWVSCERPRSGLPRENEVEADCLLVLICVGAVRILTGVGPNDRLFAQYRSLFFEEGDAEWMSGTGLLVFLLELELGKRRGIHKNRLMTYQRLARAAIERDAALRGTPRPDVEVLCERFDVARLERELRTQGESAIEAFLIRLSESEQ